MKENFKREEVHQLILEAVKNGNYILIAEFIQDLEDSPLNASCIEAHEDYMAKLLEKWEEKLK